MAISLVTGATGAIGPAVVRAFSASGYTVRVLSRQHVDGNLFGSDVDVISGDLLDPSSVERAVDGVDVIVHLAALLHIVNPPPHLAGDYQRINVDATRALFEVARRARVRRFIYFSTIAVYGIAPQKPWSELIEPRPDTFYAQTKLEAERHVLAEYDGRDTAPIGVVLRMAAVYGPRIKGNYRRLVQSLARGTFVPIGSGQNRRSVIYDEDAGRAAVAVAAHSAAAGQIFNVSDGVPRSVDEIISAICAGLGRRPPRFHVPLGPVRATARVLDGVARTMGRSLPISRMIEKYMEDVVVDDRKIRSMIGFRPQVDLYEGWAETIRRMRDSGDLR